MFIHISPIEAPVALGVVIATAVTDAVYVLFSAAVASRRRVAAASWSGLWYLLSSFAVISYTRNWEYVWFAALGSWIGAYASMSLLHEPRARSQTSLAPPLEPPGTRPTG